MRQRRPSRPTSTQHLVRPSLLQGRPLPSAETHTDSVLDRLAAWARDEPPSPKEYEPNEGAGRLYPDPRRPSDVASQHSSAPGDDPGPSRWWTFARHRPTDSGSIPLSPSSPTRPPRRPRDGSRSMSIPWLTGSMLRRSQEQQQEAVAESELESPSTVRGVSTEDGRTGAASVDELGGATRLNNRSRLRIDMPPPNAQFTLAQNITPGWETPWTSAHPNGSGVRIGSSRDEASQHDEEKLTPWQRRRKRLRAYMMYNVYVPLVRRRARRRVLHCCLMDPRSYSACAISSSQLLPSPSPSGSAFWRSAAALSVLSDHLRASSRPLRMLDDIDPV